VIRHVAGRGAHPQLRWGRFPDYRDEVERAYQSVDFQPLWVRDGRPTPQAMQVIDSLARADDRGLSPADYDAARLRTEAAALASAPSPGARAIGLFDSALTVSTMRYISDSYIGRIDPRRVNFSFDSDHRELDLAKLIPELARDEAPQRRLAEFEPPLPIYGRLKQALAHLRTLARRTDMTPVPSMPVLHPGESDDAVPVLRHFLTVLGDLPPEAAPPPDPHLYDQTLVAAVKHFQQRHGLDPDGVIGRNTLRELQVPLAARVRQIELAMERLRWLPYRPASRFILVNIPEFRLRAFDEGRPGGPLAMKVVVGSAVGKRETPVLYADMRYVVFRPRWNVPYSITRKEMLPHLRRDPGYLDEQDLEIVDHSGGTVREPPVGDILTRLSSGALRLRQRSGPHNALGLVKFLFPNPAHVYLHDTPAKTLFRHTRRDFSHGCIRVEDPVALAEFVLRGQDHWSRERILHAMDGPRTQWVTLRSPFPVYLFYTTVVVERDGELFFFDDIYGHDARLARLLAQGYPYSEAAR
jgi:murein L,D-transpeptidase YcbB/YkuD